MVWEFIGRCAEMDGGDGWAQGERIRTWMRVVDSPIPSLQELGAKLVGRCICPVFEDSTPITITAFAKDAEQPLFHFASPNLLSSAEMATDLIRFIDLIDGVALSGSVDAFAGWIIRLSP